MRVEKLNKTEVHTIFGERIDDAVLKTLLGSG